MRSLKKFRRVYGFFKRISFWFSPRVTSSHVKLIIRTCGCLPFERHIKNFRAFVTCKFNLGELFTYSAFWGCVGFGRWCGTVRGTRCQVYLSRACMLIKLISVFRVFCSCTKTLKPFSFNLNGLQIFFKNQTVSRQLLDLCPFFFQSHDEEANTLAVFLYRKDRAQKIFWIIRRKREGGN